MADEGLPTTYALIYNFLKTRSHAKAAAAVKKAAKEASVVILKDNPEETEQDDLNQIVKAWKEKKSEQLTETSSSEDSDSDSESSSQSDSSDTTSSSSSNSEGKSSHAAKANGKSSNKSKTNASSETSHSDSSSQSSSESEMERKPGIGAKPKVNSKSAAPKSHSPPKPQEDSSSDSDSSDSTSSEEESDTSDTKSSSSDSKSEEKRNGKKSEAARTLVSETNTATVKITKKRRLSDSGQAKITAVDEDSNTPLQGSKRNGKLQVNDENGKAVATPLLDKGDNKKPRKSNTPFQRIKQEDVVFHDDRLKDNTYMARGGAANDYGAKASQDLIITRGDSFRKAKNKKKRGSYRGGEITLESHSIKFT